MAKIDLSKYGISGTNEIVHNPSYDMLFEEETKSNLEGFEKGQVSELGAVNVMTPFGGQATNIKTTTTLLQKRLGRLLKTSRSKSFQTKDSLLWTLSAVQTKTRVWL